MSLVQSDDPHNLRLRGWPATPNAYTAKSGSAHVIHWPAMQFIHVDCGARVARCGPDWQPGNHLLDGAWKSGIYCSCLIFHLLWLAL